MSVAEIAVLLALLGLLQLLLAVAARLLGLWLPWQAAALGAGLPLAFLAPWILGTRLLVPSNDLGSAIPGARPHQAPDPHALLNDVVYQLLPWELEVRHALSERRLPLWSDGLEGGSSPWLNPQSGALSPLAMLARPLPIQRHPLAVLAFEMMILIEGTWLVVRLLGAGRLAASLAGAGGALSGVLQAWALLPPSAAACWLPWVALAAIRIVRRPRPLHVVTGGLFAGAITLAGNPEVAALGLAAAALWGLALARAPLDRRGLAAAALAVGLGSGLAAPVMVPFLERVPSSQRVDELGAQRVPLEVLDWSPRTWLEPRQAILLEAPLGAQVFGRPYRGLFQGTLNWAEASAGYAGLLALAGSAVALASPRVRRRALPFLVTSAVALALAAGFLPLRALLQAIPGVGLVAPGRLLPLVAFGLTVAGGVGLGELLRGRGWAPSIAVVAAAALSLRADTRAAAVALWLGVIAVAIGSARARARAAALVLAAVLALDLGPWAYLLLPRGDTASFYPVTTATEALRRETAAGGPWRVTGEDLAAYPSLLTVYGLDELRPHNPLAPRAFTRALQLAFGFDPGRHYFGVLHHLDHPLLDFVNVRALVSYSTRPGAPGYRPVPAGLERFDAGELGTFRLLRNREALPRAFVPVSAEVVRADQLDDWVARLRDPRRVALERGEVGDWRPMPRRFDPGAVSVESWRPGSIELAVALPAGGLIATSIPGPEGWRAEAGGRELERVRVNGAFLGVRVPAGVDRVALRYRPPGLMAGVALAAVALAVLLGLVLLGRGALIALLPRRRRRSRPRLAAAVAGLVAIFLFASLARETVRALRPYWIRGPFSFREANPARWRLASAPVERLSAFLELAASQVPAGARVAFAGEPLEGTEGAYRAMWATYLLPRHHVIPAGQEWDGEWWIAYRVRVDRPDLELVWENADGAVYRARGRESG